MSDTVKANVYARCPLGGLPRFLLVTLADECDDAGIIQINHERVMRKLGVDQRTLTRMIARCEADAGLVYVPGNGRGNGSTYILAAYTDEPVKVDKVDNNAPLSSPPKPVKVDTVTTLSTFARPAKSPPTRDVFIPPPVSEDQEDSAANAARRQSRPPTAQQAMFGECADVIGVDLALIDDDTKTNLGKLAAAFIAEGVPLGMPTEAWATERRRIAGFADGRTISPPTVKRLRTLVGAYRKAKAEGTAIDLPGGQSIDPATGRRVVVWENMR